MAKRRAKRKAGRSRKTSWDSQEEWNRDKPTVKWVFPFIDKNSDGKINKPNVLFIAVEDLNAGGNEPKKCSTP